MSKVIKIKDSQNLVLTKKFKYGNWPFKEFNPVQSRLFEIFQGDSNVAIAASTSAGKTVCAEMYLSYEIRKNGGKGIYVGPLKALAKEKEQDWSCSSHHFGDLKTFIATGDFRFTSKRVQEMEESNLVVMTPEMLASRCRSHKSDKSKFLYDVNVVVFDESHLLTVPSRGDHIEVALMKLTEINPNIRIVLLSATMPNVDEICGWISKITGRDTYYLESDYRPCPLNIHYEIYYDGDYTYDDKELQKVGTACAIVEHYSEDKFIVFVHTKRTGQLMLESLTRYGINAEFHNADLSFKDRIALEDKFKNDKNFRVLVATSTLAWGINAPARRVIVTGIHRGLSEVENYDIQQMVGRAGRPKYDPRGDAYILVPESQKDDAIRKLKKQTKIQSTLLDYIKVSDEDRHYKTLAFHIVSEINQGNVKTKDGFKKWLNKSLACFQEKNYNDSIIDDTLNLLEKYYAIFLNDKKEYQCSSIGKIASMLYYSPFDVSDLRKNFKWIFENSSELDDLLVSFALGNIDSNKWDICNKQEREIINSYKNQIDKFLGSYRPRDSSYKFGFAYYCLLKGKRNVSAISSLMNGILADSDRMFQVLNSLDTMSCKWNKQDYFRILSMRVRYGVEADLVELCQIPNVGAVRAKRLKLNKINNLEDFLNCDINNLSKIMKCGVKTVEESFNSAKEIKNKST